MTTHLSIGDFSRMTYLSIKALRRYHDLGLLLPAVVDQDTGYRYYTPDQVPVGQVIRRFRDLGMPLERVKDVVQASDPDTRNQLIVAHLRQMEDALAQTQRTVASLRALLERPPSPLVTVEYRSVPATPALAIAEPVASADLGGWWQRAFDDLHTALAAAGVERRGPDSALYSREIFEESRGQVIAYVPVPAGAPAHGRVRLTEIPAAELAVALHRGPFSDLDQTYGQLGTFVAEREIGVQGAIREHYLTHHGHTNDESDHRTEVCWPVFHTRGASP
jgi:DNA-binding transcriptional MerR regulator